MAYPLGLRPHCGHRTRALRRWLAVSIPLALVAAGAALGQAPAAAGAADQNQPEALQEVTITGSRIPVPPSISATSPTTVVTSQDIQLQGRTDMTDVLNQLPQNVISAGVDFGNQSSPLTATGGVATVDLRGLGPQRTLVLVNGRRLGVGDPSTTNPNPAPDVDQIPAPLIERVDVVTGGASATYGSDAIAGVVNFILRKDFQGIEVDGQYSIYQHNQHQDGFQNILATPDPNTGWSGITPPTGSTTDGAQHDLALIMGTNFADGAGNITGYYTYHRQDPVSGSERDFSACEGASNILFGSPVADGFECLGSSNSNRFTPTGIAPGANTRYTVLGNQFLPWPQPGSSPPGIFNFNAYQYLQREDQRSNAGFYGHYDLNDNVKPYIEFNFMDDRTKAVVAPSGLFVASNPLNPPGDGNYLINCSNPLLSAQQQSILCTPAQIGGDTANPGSPGNSANVEIGRRNIEGGGRISEYSHANYRVVVGTTGDVASGFTYDGYLSYYYVSAFSSNLNYLDYSKIANALQVTTGPNGPVCISGGTCVPYNIFGTGTVNQTQLGYLYSPGTSQGNNTEQIAHFDITGDLGKYGGTSPWATDAVGINVGAEYRKETVTFNPDAAELSGLLAGFSGASVPTDASYHVGEGFVEARAPIAQHLPGIEDLTMDVGYRYSNYNTAGVTNTYKFEVQYAPTQDARLRFSWDRAVRAPNLIELFNAPSIGQQTQVGLDPCAPTIVNGAVVAATASFTECARTGVTAAQYGNGGTTNTITQCVSGQCSEVIEGNAHLKPEVANTWSLGFTVTPRALPGFSASADYYHIRLTGVINAIPIAAILNGCLQSGNPIYCSQIVRSPAGSVTGASVAGGGYFLQQDMNLGESLVSGIDIGSNYRWTIPGDWGTLSAYFNGTWVQHFTTTPYPGSETYDCAGLFGATCNQGSVIPRWRHVMRVSWETPWQVLLSLQWRYIGPSDFDNNSTSPLLQNVEEGAYDAINARIPGYNYFDLAAIWHAYKGIDVRAGVNNIFDKDPPFLPENDISGSAGTPNSFGTYDLLGRQLFIAFSAKF